MLKTDKRMGVSRFRGGGTRQGCSPEVYAYAKYKQIMLSVLLAFRAFLDPSTNVRQ